MAVLLALFLMHFNLFEVFAVLIVANSAQGFVPSLVLQLTQHVHQFLFAENIIQAFHAQLQVIRSGKVLRFAAECFLEIMPQLVAPALEPPEVSAHLPFHPAVDSFADRKARNKFVVIIKRNIHPFDSVLYDMLVFSNDIGNCTQPTIDV